jgi:hypothetical protein
MNKKEAYKLIKENRFLKGKKVMIEFKGKYEKTLKIPATRFKFFIEEDLVRKIIRSLE